MSTQKNRITNVNLIKLSQWVVENKDILETKSLADLAVDAKKSLGFNVCGAHVGTCAESFGFKAGVGRGSGQGTKHGDVSRKLANAIARIMESLGMPEDDDITRIATR